MLIHKKTALSIRECGLNTTITKTYLYLKTTINYSIDNNSIEYKGNSSLQQKVFNDSSFRTIVIGNETPIQMFRTIRINTHENISPVVKMFKRDKTRILHLQNVFQHIIFLLLLFSWAFKS